MIPEPYPIIKPIDPGSFVPAAKAPIEAPAPLAPLDLRAARIESVALHPKADKLYLVTVDLGDEKRQIVAGLRAVYTPEELQGKTGIIVANLEPAKIRGEVSQGMLLAADGGSVVSILRIDGAAPGASVHGCTRGAPTITIAQFATVPLATAQASAGEVAAAVTTPEGPFVLTVAGAPVRVDRPVPPGSKIR